jgi:hypothetical protein
MMASVTTKRSSEEEVFIDPNYIHAHNYIPNKAIYNNNINSRNKSSSVPKSNSSNLLSNSSELEQPPQSENISLTNSNNGSNNINGGPDTPGG